MWFNLTDAKLDFTVVVTRMPQRSQVHQRDNLKGALQAIDPASLRKCTRGTNRMTSRFITITREERIEIFLHPGEKVESTFGENPKSTYLLATLLDEFQNWFGTNVTHLIFTLVFLLACIMTTLHVYLHMYHVASKRVMVWFRATYICRYMRAHIYDLLPKDLSI